MPIAGDEAQRKSAAKKRAFLWDYKESKGCQVCGESDPVVLEFDHIDPTKKTRNDIEGRNTRWRNLSWEKIHAELELCQVLCANCHRRKTYGDNRPLAFSSFTDERGRHGRGR